MSLLETLNSVRADLKITKGRLNQHAGFKYWNTDDLLSALKPVLHTHKAGILIKDEIVTVEGRFYVKATVEFRAIDNADMFTAVGYAREPDKLPRMQDPQVTGTASTYARKYALSAMFLLDDEQDPDSMSNHPAEHKAPDEIPMDDRPKAPNRTSEECIELMNQLEMDEETRKKSWAWCQNDLNLLYKALESRLHDTKLKIQESLEQGNP